MQAAISKGADVNAQDQKDTRQKTPPMYAARYNPNPEVITTLLKAGAEIEARDVYGGTPLILAAMGNKNPEVIRVLVEAGSPGP